MQMRALCLRSWDCSKKVLLIQNQLVAAYEKLFSEKDRNEIKKMRLPFKDLMIIIQTAMELIQGEEDQGEQ